LQTLASVRCALARANRDFSTDERRIRTEIKVTNQTKSGSGWSLSKIVDFARMCFSSARNQRSARTGRRPRKPDYHSSNWFTTSARDDFALAPNQ